MDWYGGLLGAKTVGRKGKENPKKRERLRCRERLECRWALNKSERKAQTQAGQGIAVKGKGYVSYKREGEKERKREGRMHACMHCIR